MSQNKKFLRKIGIICMAAGCVFGGSASATCTPKSTFSTVKPGILTVSTAQVPPFSYTDSSGKLLGLDGEVINRFADENCLAVSVMTVESSAAIQYVVSSRSDLSTGGWYRTSERAKVLGISAPIYLEPPAIYSKDGYKNFSDLKGKRVGTVQGYAWVNDLKGIYGDSLRLYPNPVGLTQDLASGRLDAAINSLAIGIEARKQGAIPKDYSVLTASADPQVASSVNPAQTSVLFSKSNPALGAALNQTISDMSKDGGLKTALRKFGVPEGAADVGEARFAD